MEGGNKGGREGKKESEKYNFIITIWLLLYNFKAADVDLFWHWSRETLVQNLYPGVLYNNKSGAHKGFISDRNNYLVGISRLRQARMKKGEDLMQSLLAHNSRLSSTSTNFFYLLKLLRPLSLLSS